MDNTEKLKTLEEKSKAWISLDADPHNLKEYIQQFLRAWLERIRYREKYLASQEAMKNSQQIFEDLSDAFQQFASGKTDERFLLPADATSNPSPEDIEKSVGDTIEMFNEADRTIKSELSNNPSLKKDYCEEAKKVKEAIADVEKYLLDIDGLKEEIDKNDKAVLVPSNVVGLPENCLVFALPSYEDRMAGTRESTLENVAKFVVIAPDRQLEGDMVIPARYEFGAENGKSAFENLVSDDAIKVMCEKSGMNFSQVNGVHHTIEELHGQAHDKAVEAIKMMSDKDNILKDFKAVEKFYEKRAERQKDANERER